MKGMGPGEEESRWNQLVAGCVGLGDRISREGGVKREGETEEVESFGLERPGGGPVEDRAMSGAKAQQTKEGEKSYTGDGEHNKERGEGRVYYD